MGLRLLCVTNQMPAGQSQPFQMKSIFFCNRCEKKNENKTGKSPFFAQHNWKWARKKWKQKWEFAFFALQHQMPDGGWNQRFGIKSILVKTKVINKRESENGSLPSLFYKTICQRAKDNPLESSQIHLILCDAKILKSWIRKTPLCTL